MSTLKQAYLLRQHTPLIHFQPDQAQSFLRASEVKPRLDAYIIAQMEKDNTPIPDSWKVAFEHGQYNKALNYKLFVRPAEKLQPFRIEREGHKGRAQQFPGYFANMGEKDKSKHKYFVFTGKDAVVSVQSFNQELLAKVLAALPNFFATHNFMSRKTKGFGSFTLVTGPGDPIPPSASNYNFVVNCGHKDPWQEFNRLFERIDLFYRTLRSGINFVRGSQSMLYFKSLLYHYAQQQGEEWDKKKMKLELFHNDKGPAKARLYRDMLGLASTVDWLDQRAKVEKSGSNIIEYEEDGKTYSEKVEIARFPSPITFKPVHLGNGRYRVYILTEPMPKVMLNADFGISSNRGGNTRIRTPDSFNVRHYLDFAVRFFKKQDFKEYVGNYDRNKEREVNTLQDIYTQLSEQA
jgi:hypothetical protein